MQLEIPIRIIVEHPPRGVAFRVQRGREGLLSAAAETPERLSFQFTVRLGPPLPDGRPNLLGEFTQGPRSARFIYVNSGTCAGQTASSWTRRAKVPLKSVTAAQIDALCADPDAVLTARIHGTACDGGPACATVPLLDGGWHVLRRHAKPTPGTAGGPPAGSVPRR